ncbi:MAG TPA: prepilin-type N-terminal cleavage/methylation domain-containing protein [Phycisphaerales bacterium]|nr:prepilin-type N-terminal cleavage/methylation domain-containing protein [Phycisphaerales bacterium]
MKTLLRNVNRRRGFSMIEVLVSLMITGLLLTATLTALDASFKAYQVTTEGASSNVIARTVMHRMSAMVRTGTDFGPYPDDVLDAANNPMDSTFMEFSLGEVAGGTRVVRLERRDAPQGSSAPYELWYVEQLVDGAGAVTTDEARPLLVGLTELNFNLEYDVGPRLKRATIDLTVLPNDFQDASFKTELHTDTIRLVSTVSPRKLDE